MATACEQIAQNIGTLFTCDQVNEFTRVRTPFLYPDGDAIDLFLKESATGLVLTDLGTTIQWLRLQTAAQKRALRQKLLIEDVCQTHTVEFHRGMLQIPLAPEDDLATAVTRLSQAAARVADLWFTFRGRVILSAADEVADFLDQRGISFERNEQIEGLSGRSWRLDFHARPSERDVLIQVLASGSQAAAHRVAEHAAIVWADLVRLRSGPPAHRFLSVFDDSTDVWTPEDVKLVEAQSEVALLSEADALMAATPRN